MREKGFKKFEIENEKWEMRFFNENGREPSSDECARWSREYTHKEHDSLLSYICEVLSDLKEAIHNARGGK